MKTIYNGPYAWLHQTSKFHHQAPFAFAPPCAWVFFSTVLPWEFIYVKFHIFIIILKTRLGGEIYSSDINMRKGYYQNLFKSFLYVIKSNLSLRTPLYYGQFLWSQKCQKSYIPYLYNTVTSVKQTLSSVALVSASKRFDCIKHKHLNLKCYRASSQQV